MRNKAPLALMEQLVMLLVFALAAALCVQVFVLSDRTSEENKQRDQAVVAAQNAAELLKATHGDYEALSRLLGAGEETETGVELTYTESWTPGEGPYTLTVDQEPGTVPGLGLAEVRVTTDTRELFSLTVAWQTEMADTKEVAQP